MNGWRALHSRRAIASHMARGVLSDTARITQSTKPSTKQESVDERP